MNNNNHKTLFRSITFKFILIVIIFGIILNIAIWAFFRLSSPIQPRRIIPSYIQRMNDYVIKDIGSPPDTLKARIISDDLNLNIRFQSASFNWSSKQDVPNLEELSHLDEFKNKYPVDDRFNVGYKGRIVHVIKSGNGVFIMYPAAPKDFFSIERAILALIVLVSVIFIPLIFVLKWLFNPINKLSDAVNSIGEGKYDVDVNIKRNDEFGQLGRSIKEMASRINNSISSKEQLLLDVSHELRTPLTRIKLGLEVDAPKEKINDDVREIEQLINNLLDSYRHDYYFYDLSLENKKIVPVIKDVINEYDNNVRLWFKIPANENVTAQLDEKKFKIVLRNILENALKFSADKVEININEYKEKAEVTVSDKGQGIPKEDIDFIFEPFYRSDRSRSKVVKGFGLGLSIVKKIMDAHEGKVEIESQESKGTTVKLFLKK